MNNNQIHHRVEERELVGINKARAKVGLKPRETEMNYKDHLNKAIQKHKYYEINKKLL